jgi:hypothetical protein
MGSAFISTVANNCQSESDTDSIFERSAITETPVYQEFRNSALGYVREHGQQFLERFDRWLTDSSPVVANDGGSRIGVGVYFYEQPPITKAH